MGVNLIRKNNQSQVTAYQDAVFLDFIKGFPGVFKDVYDQFAYLISGKTFTLKSGMGIVYGRQFELEKGTTHVFDFSSETSQKYVTVFAEIDTRDPANELVVLKAMTNVGSHITLTSNNIVKSELGLAYLPLYRFIITPTNQVPIANIEQLFKVLIPNEVEYAEIAKSLPSTSTIKGKLVNDIISDNKAAVKLSENTEKINGITIDKNLKVNGYLINRSKLMASQETILNSNQVGTNIVSTPLYPDILNFKILFRYGGSDAINTTLNDRFNNSEFEVINIALKYSQTTKVFEESDYKIIITKSINGDYRMFNIQVQNKLSGVYNYIKYEYKIYGEVYE